MDYYKEEYHLLDIRWLDEKLPENEGQQLRDNLASLSEDFQKVSLVILHALAMALGGEYIQFISDFDLHKRSSRRTRRVKV